MKNIFRALAVGLFLAGSLLKAAPAKAFYFELPQVLKNAIQALRAYPAQAQEAEEPRLPETTISPAPPMPPASYESSPSTPSFNPSPTCRIDGVEQPGSCEQLKQSEGFQSPPPNNQSSMDQKNMQGPDSGRMLKDIQRGAREIERQLKQFEMLVVKMEKRGVAVSAEIKAKIADLRALSQKFLSASIEDAQNLDMDEMWQKMRDLEEERRNLEQMDNIMREMRRIESGVKTFEKQVQKLAKQKLAVPAGVTESLEKVKAAIADIKAGKMENAEDIFELMRDLDESRGQMEMLARWPQTAKEMDRQVKNLERELKRSKLTADRLNKKGIDLTSVYAQFEAAVLKLKATRDAAKNKVQENAEDAFEMVQNDFFGQMEDVWENQKIIMMVSNFGQFQADYTREMNKATQEIKMLKRQKLDTAELEELLAKIKAKGAEVKELLKARPLDADATVEALGEMENLGQEFDNKTAELTGKEDEMPWEKGPQQFKQVEVSPNLDKWIPRPAP